MIVKFFRRSKESGSKPINYFLGAKRDRKYARVLSGDPVVTEHLINATSYQNKYKSGVLSFTERVDEISESDKTEIMRSFEETLFPGLEPDQYDILWIEHSDKETDEDHPKGRLELNFVIPCQELRSGDRLQPFYAGTDMPRVNAWKNIVNRDIKTVEGHSLADPNEPSRKRKINPYLGSAPKPTPYNTTPKKAKSKNDLDISSRDALRASIHQHMLAKVTERDNRLKNREAVVDELNNGLGLIIERTVKTSITISHPAVKDKNDKPLRIRLEGGIYHKDFNPKNFEPAAQKAYDTNEIRRKLRDDDVYQTAMAIKTEQNRELYAEAIAPPPLDIDVRAVVAALSEQKPDQPPMGDKAVPRTHFRP